MSKILDALNNFSQRVEANAAPDDEKRPEVLNLAAEDYYGKYKFIPIMPANSNEVLPFVTAHFNEIKLHIKGAKFDSWKRVISTKDIDLESIPEEHAELIKTCQDILKDISKMKDAEFHKVTRGYKKKEHNTYRFKTYVIWYAYIIEAKDRKGNIIKDAHEKFRLMVLPTVKMENAVNECFKTIMDNYEDPIRTNAIESLFGGGIEGRKNYFELSVERPKNYEINLTPMLHAPGMKINIPEKLMTDAGYANLSSPLIAFTYGKEGQPYSVETLKLIKKTLLERMDKDSADIDLEDTEDAETEEAEDTTFTAPESEEDPKDIPF